jgi:hypothetical protein
VHPRCQRASEITEKTTKKTAFPQEPARMVATGLARLVSQWVWDDPAILQVQYQ